MIGHWEDPGTGIRWKNRIVQGSLSTERKEVLGTVDARVLGVVGQIVKF